MEWSGGGGGGGVDCCWLRCTCGLRLFIAVCTCVGTYVVCAPSIVLSESAFILVGCPVIL